MKDWSIGLAILIAVLTTSVAMAYETAIVENGATLIGDVRFKGTVPDPMTFEVQKNPDVCGRSRTLVTVSVKNGMLKDAVVMIHGIERGKPFELKDQGIDIMAQNCAFLPFTGVMMGDGQVRINNRDSIFHNPHAYERKGKARWTLFNKPLVADGGTIQEKVRMRRGPVMDLECDQHPFMLGFFLTVTNPYYFVVGEDGKFLIDQVPPGYYKVTAWHPKLGTVEKEIDIKGNTTVDLTFDAK